MSVLRAKEEVLSSKRMAWGVLLGTLLVLCIGQITVRAPLDDVYLPPNGTAHTPGYGYIMLSTNDYIDCNLWWGSGMSFKVGLYDWTNNTIVCQRYPVYNNPTTIGPVTHSGWYSFGFVNLISTAGTISVAWEGI